MTAAMVFGLTAQAQRAGSTGEKIQFSEPSNPLSISNLNNLSAAGQSTSKKLQDDLSRSSGINLGEQNLSSSIALPQPSLNPIIQNQRSKEFKDRNKNWIFREMNDLSSDDPLKDRLGLWQTGDKEKKAMSPMERYFESSDRKNDKSANPWSEKSGAGKDGDFTSPNVLNSSGAKLSPTEQMFRSFNGPDLSDNPFVPPGAAGGGVVDHLSNFGSPLHPLRTPEQQKRMDEFQEILTGHPVITPASSLNADALPSNIGASADYRSALNPAMLGDINSGLNFHSRAFEDPSARVFGSPSPAKAVEKPKAWTEPQLQGLPQRKF